MKYITDVYSKFKKVTNCPICDLPLVCIDFDKKCPSKTSTTTCGVVHIFISHDRVTVSTTKYKIGMAIRFSRDIVTIFRHPAINPKDQMIFRYDDGSNTSHVIGNRAIGKPHPIGPRMVFYHRNKSFVWYESSLFVELKYFDFNQPNVLEVKESYINFINKIIDNMDLM